MSKKIFLKSAQAALLVVLIIVIQQCGGNDSVSPTGTYMGGTITYTSTNLVLTNGYYAVSFYGDSTTPFGHTPIKTDSLGVGIGGGLASTYYKESNLPSGNYYIASTWIRTNPPDHHVFVLGALGCNISHPCPDPTVVAFPNYAGTAALDFLSRTSPDSVIYP